MQPQNVEVGHVILTIGSGYFFIPSLILVKISYDNFAKFSV